MEDRMTRRKLYWKQAVGSEAAGKENTIQEAGHFRMEGTRSRRIQYRR
jgi:hypothetical protein